MSERKTWCGLWLFPKVPPIQSVEIEGGPGPLFLVSDLQMHGIQYRKEDVYDARDKKETFLALQEHDMIPRKWPKGVQVIDSKNVLSKGRQVL